MQGVHSTNAAISYLDAHSSTSVFCKDGTAQKKHNKISQLLSACPRRWTEAWMKTNAFFPVRGRKSKLSVLFECCYVVLSFIYWKCSYTSCTEPLTPVSSRDHPHNLCICLSALSNSSSATRLSGQILHLTHTHTHTHAHTHTHTDSPPPLPPRPMHIHHNYAQQEFK